MNFSTSKQNKGFTLVEMIVVIAIVSALASVVLFAILSARQDARDKQRITDLKQIEFALRLYYEKNGYYPPACDDTSSNTGTQYSAWVGDMDSTADSFDCSTGTDYIVGLVPTFIPKLPIDPYTPAANTGYLYKVKKIDGKAVDYKILAYHTVERMKIASGVVGYDNEFARCSKVAYKSDGITEQTYCSSSGPETNTYAIYTQNADGW